MSDKKYLDDEYQFPVDEFVDKSATQTPTPEHEAVVEEEMVAETSKTTGVLGFISRKRKLVFFVVVVVAGFVGYKYLTSNQPVPQPTPVVAAPAPVVTDPKVEDQIDKLTQVVMKNQQTISDMQDQLDNTQSALARANQAYDKTNDTLNALAQQLGKVQAQLAAKPKPAAPVKKVVPIVYNLKAIVPGRAWVLGSNGDAETVSVGDSLPQYGQVTNVDADKGVVLTSSGKVIEYGVNDF